MLLSLLEHLAINTGHLSSLHLHPSLMITITTLDLISNELLVSLIGINHMSVVINNTCVLEDILFRRIIFINNLVLFEPSQTNTNVNVTKIFSILSVEFTVSSTEIQLYLQFFLLCCSFSCLNKQCTCYYGT